MAQWFTVPEEILRCNIIRRVKISVVYFSTRETGNTIIAFVALDLARSIIGIGTRASRRHKGHSPAQGPPLEFGELYDTAVKPGMEALLAILASPLGSPALHILKDHGGRTMLMSEVDKLTGQVMRHRLANVTCLAITPSTKAFLLPSSGLLRPFGNRIESSVDPIHVAAIMQKLPGQHGAILTDYRYGDAGVNAKIDSSDDLGTLRPQLNLGLERHAEAKSFLAQDKLRRLKLVLYVINSMAGTHNPDVSPYPIAIDEQLDLCALPVIGIENHVAFIQRRIHIPHMKAWRTLFLKATPLMRLPLIIACQK